MFDERHNAAKALNFRISRLHLGGPWLTIGAQQTADVLDNHVPRSQASDGVGEHRPQPRPGASLDAGAAPGR
ncbi:hypothetical protein AWB94_04750 [Mycolicibacterium canariasense]|nr:hypothetical protein AWB94_04750 [Mycolicibacterium canariasense]